jgi:hypothetical protein
LWALQATVDKLMDELEAKQLLLSVLIHHWHQISEDIATE